MKKEDLLYTEGSIIRGVWRLGWPAVTSMFLETFLSITDAFWVGKLGAVQMAAVTSSMFPIWTFFSFLTVVPIGVLAIISRAVGARETGSVSRSAGQSLVFAVRVGILCSIVGLVLSSWIFDLMATSPDITRLGVAYLRIFFIGAVFFVVNETFSGIFRAAGDAKAQLIGSMSAVLLNIGLDPLLIFGIGPFPRWGTSGASLATIISAACGTLVYIIMIFRGRLQYTLRFRFLEKLDYKLAWTIVRIGFPPAISGVIFSVVYIFVNRIVAGFGTDSIAALMIGHRMESLWDLNRFGISMAASTMVGQNLGAGKPDRAARSAWVSVGISCAVTTFIALMFLIFPRQLSLFFIQDEGVVSIAIHYLRILALSQMFMAASIVLDGAFAGAGNTVPPTSISIPGSIVRLPVAYYLCYIIGVGVNGVWWAITISTWARALVTVYWFSRNRWKKIGVIKSGDALQNVQFDEAGSD
jgi:putative MATE family efflux protein